MPRGAVEVHLYGRFRRLAPQAAPTAESIVEVSVEDGDTIQTVLRHLGIDPADVCHLFLNAQYSGTRRRLKAGDRLGIFPREMAVLYRQYFPKIEG